MCIIIVILINFNLIYVIQFSVTFQKLHHRNAVNIQVSTVLFLLELSLIRDLLDDALPTKRPKLCLSFSKK